MDLSEFLDVSADFRAECPTNAMTVDVEDYFQVYALEERIERTQWDSLELRVAGNIDRILALFDQAGVKATFFTLGWVAERIPEVMRRIAQEGHEVASHGFEHQRVFNQTRAQFTEDVGRTKKLLEDTIGQEVLGFRAASYSIGKPQLWALAALAEVGYLYSSSIYPIRHDFYGIPDSPRFAFRLNDRAFTEFPVSTVEFAGRRIPCGGGGYFRLLPYAISRWAIRRVNRVDKQPSIFYFHPWEVDPDQPRVEGLSFRSQFRHYVNLGKTEQRLKRLIREFRWGPMRDVFSISR